MEVPYDEETTLSDDVDFIQNKHGYCFYTNSVGLYTKTNDVRPLIFNLYVFPASRRRGHARRLLTLVISSIRASGYTGEICVQVSVQEQSIAHERLVEFYRSLGLVILRIVDEPRRACT